MTLTNTCGESSPQYFNIPAAGGMLRAFPNPAIDNVKLELKNVETKELVPLKVALISESNIEVKSVQVLDLYNSKLLNKKIVLDVKSLPRGIYYLHVTPQSESTQKTEKIRIQLQ